MDNDSRIRMPAVSAEQFSGQTNELRDPTRRTVSILRGAREPLSVMNNFAFGCTEAIHEIIVFRSRFAHLLGIIRFINF